MTETNKTVAFVTAAAVMLVTAIVVGFVNQPRAASDFETIGEPFYPEFEGTDQAKSLIVTAFDPLAVKRQEFEIREVDGLWEIPSHDGYPAEAAERLARTSASLMGLTRDSLVGRRESDHTKFGVVDPLEEDIVDVDSIGQSITLRDAGDDVLVDLIIGNKANEDDSAANNGPNGPGAEDEDSYYYVRRRDEANVYRIPLKIDLSTKFSDWIEPDLLQLQASDVTRLELNNYSIEERSSGFFGETKELMKTPGDQILLSRTTSTDDWELEDLKPDSETVAQDKIAEMVAILDDMEIVDVAKKPSLDGRILLDADLNYSVSPEQAELLQIRTTAELNALSRDQQLAFQNLQMGIAELQRDLESKGFNFGSTGSKLELVSAGGEVEAGTVDGLRYILHIGKSKTGASSEIKVSGASDSEPEDGKSGDADSKSADAGSDPKTEASVKEEATDDAAKADESEESSSKNRYVLIRVAFDEDLLPSPGEKPVAPTEPEKPAGYVAATPTDADQEKPSTEDQADNADTEDDGADESDDAPVPDVVERDPAFVAYDAAMEAYASAKIDFEVATSQYEQKLDDRKEQIKSGKEKAAVLNQRFEKWYYIVAGDNLQTLQSDRDEIVTAKEPDDGNAAGGVERGMGAIPNTSFPDLVIPEGGSPETSGEVEMKKPSTEMPVTESIETGPASSEEGTDSESAGAASDGEVGDEKENASEPPVESESKVIDTAEEGQGTENESEPNDSPVPTGTEPTEADPAEPKPTSETIDDAPSNSGASSTEPASESEPSSSSTEGGSGGDATEQE